MFELFGIWKKLFLIQLLRIKWEFRFIIASLDFCRFLWRVLLTGLVEDGGEGGGLAPSSHLSHFRRQNSSQSVCRRSFSKQCMFRIIAWYHVVNPPQLRFHSLAHHLKLLPDVFMHSIVRISASDK